MYSWSDSDRSIEEANERKRRLLDENFMIMPQNEASFCYKEGEAKNGGGM